MSYLSTDKSKQLHEGFQYFVGTSIYAERKEQSKFCNFARAFIRYLVEHDKFDENSATLLVKIFAVRAKRSTIEEAIKEHVSDDKDVTELTDLLAQCSGLGYTAVGKSKIDLTQTQAQLVAKFLKQILESTTVGEIKAAVSAYTEQNIPYCTTGIYSPWLHYIHPTLCPIANRALNSYLDFVGVPKYKRGDYLLMMDVLEEAKAAAGAEDYSVLDSFFFDEQNYNHQLPFYRVMDNLNDPNSGVQVWSFDMSYGQWDQWVDEDWFGIMNENLDLSQYDSKEDFRDARSASGLPETNAVMIQNEYAFYSTMKEGDVVLARRGTDTLLGWGEVTSEHGFAPDDEVKNYRNIEWHTLGEIPYSFKAHGIWFLQLDKDEYAPILEVISNIYAKLEKLCADFVPTWSKSGFDEAYKWKIVKQEMTTEEMLKTLCATNLFENNCRITISSHLKSNPTGLCECFELLENENVPLLDRIASYRTAIAKLCDEKESVPDNERIIAAYLMCIDADKYAPYMSVKLYKPFCEFLGIPQKNSSENYPHYLNILRPLAEVIGADYSLLSLFQSIAGPESDRHDLLSAQTVLWVMQEQWSKLHDARYWVFNHTYQEASPEEKLNLIQQAVASNYAMMQYEYGYQKNNTVTSNWKQALRVREGDYIFLRCDRFFFAVGRVIKPRLKSTVELEAGKIIRSNDHKSYISGNCNEVVTFKDSEVFYENLTEGYKNNWGQRIDVEAWQFYNPKGLWLDGDIYEDNNPYNTIREVKREKGTELVNQLYRSLGMKTEILEQLKESHNLILTGAPGTGKTYMAMQVARLMLFGKTEHEELNDTEKAIFEQHVEFVQFHPNYDYTDFVEGLRPIESQDGKSLGFERKDGVFKSFCKRAISNDESVVENFEEAWSALIATLDDNDYVDVKLLSGKGTFRVELNEYGTGLASRTYADDQFVKGEWISGKSKFFSKEQLLNIYHGFSGVPGRGHDNYRRAILEHMKQNFGLKDYKQEKKSADAKPYILIIDEINRGEMSKILGELFFAIDPGYRGTKGRIDTQYQNLISESDVFKSGFYIPENVYIIGTMNDIDRSVESMDFAIRRRFAWMEVLATDTAYILNALDSSIRQKALDCMTRLNEAILDPNLRLGADYQIGATYFLKLLKNPDFENLWNRSLKGVLKEYLRGQRDIDEKISKLYEAYKG